MKTDTGQTGKSGSTEPWEEERGLEQGCGGVGGGGGMGRLAVEEENVQGVQWHN